MQKMKKLLKKNKGFTLIEMIVVVGIIGVLVAILLPRFADIREKSYEKANIANGKAVISALEAYYTDNMSYPAASTYYLGSAAGLSGYLSSALVNPYTSSAYSSASEANGTIAIITVAASSSVPASFKVNVYGRSTTSLLSFNSKSE